jgi:predicted HTH domain antitoxin
VKRRPLQGAGNVGKVCAMKDSETVAINVELPASIPKEEAQLMLALKLYEKGRLTLGQAAHTAGYSKRAFVDLLGQEGIPVINSDPQELAAEINW